jgi:hypothetical protein
MAKASSRDLRELVTGKASARDRREAAGISVHPSRSKKGRRGLRVVKAKR